MTSISLNTIKRIAFIIMVFMVSMFNYGGGQMLKIATNASIVLFVGIMFMTSYDSIRIPPPFKYMAVFLGVCMISCLYSTARASSINRVETLLIVTMELLAVYEYIREEKDINTILRILSAAAITTALYVDVQGMSVIGTVRRVGRITGDSNQVSAYMVYGIALLLFMFIMNRMPRIISAAGIVLSFFAIMLQGSRSAIVCAGFIFIIETLLMLKYKKARLTKKIAAVLILVAIVSAVIYYILTDPVMYMTIGRRLVSFYEISATGTSSINEQSVFNRMTSYKFAWKRFKSSPLLGTGIDTFSNFSKESVLNREGFCPNNYLEIIQGVGIIGVVAYYITYLYLFKESVKGMIRHIDSVSVLVLCITIAMLIEHISVVFYYQKLEYLYLGFMLAAVQKCCQMNECEKPVLQGKTEMVGEAA